MKHALPFVSLVVLSAAFSACGLSIVGIPDPDAIEPAPDAPGPNLPETGGFDTSVTETSVDAPVDGDGGGCGDVLSDPLNCGACGHSCAGRACTNGFCATEIITDFVDPQGIALSAAHVYVGVRSANEIRRIDLATLGAPALIQSTNAPPTAMWTDGTKLAFITDDAVGIKDLDANTTATLGVGGGGVGLAVVNLRVYFTSGSGGKVTSFDFGLNAGREHADTQAAPIAVTADATRVYWTNRSGGSIGFVGVNSGIPVFPILAQDGPNGIAVDATHLYWSTAGAIRRADLPLPVAFPTTKELAKDLKHPVSLTLDGNFLYWIEQETGALKRMSVDGGPPLVLATGLPEAADVEFTQLLAINATHVYWLSNVNGTLRRVAK